MAKGLAFMAFSFSALLTLLSGGYGMAGSPQRITAAELKTIIEKKEPVTVIDVRTPEEYSQGHIPGSVSIHAMGDLKSFSYQGRVVLYCASGKRSLKALKVFEEKGVKGVVDLEGGIKAWEAAGGNVVAGPYNDITRYPESYEIPKGVCETKEPAMKMGK